MSDALTRYVILIRSLDPQEPTPTWSEVVQRFEGRTPTQAINALRREIEKLDRGTVFVAIPERQWTPRRMVQQLVEKWSLQPVEHQQEEEIPDAS